MGVFFSSGHAVDLVLAFLALEVALLAWSRRASLIGATVAALPGALLLLALRAALTNAGWIWVAGWVALSLPAHLLDLARRPP
jgi:hypothetical protein